MMAPAVVAAKGKACVGVGHRELRGLGNGLGKHCARRALGIALGAALGIALGVEHCHQLMSAG